MIRELVLFGLLSALALFALVLVAETVAPSPPTLLIQEEKA
jgi:hypothetical protein